MHRASSAQHAGPDNPHKIHVSLPDAPPDVTESVAAALLHLLLALVADPAQARTEAGNGQQGRTPLALVARSRYDRSLHITSNTLHARGSHHT